MLRRFPIVGHDLARVRESSPASRVGRAGLQVVACMVMTLIAGCGGSPSGPSPPPPPSLTCPADITQVQSGPGQPTVVTYTTPTAANGAPPVTVSCVPGSGSAFDLGSTDVACTATDALSRTATCSFEVTVTEVPQVEKVKFLAFGDSVTEGTISSPCPAVEGVDTLWMKMAVVKPESYPYKLQQLLAARYTSQTVTVVNEGRAGERVASGTERLPGILDSAEPEVLLLLHGFNDLLAAGRRDTFGSEIPRIAGELEDMVKIGRSHKATVLLATMPAMDASGCRGQGAPGVLEMNDAVRRVAADEGAALVDLYQGLGGSPAGVIGIDGLHPTEEGYTKMAQVWFDAIRREFERPSTTGAAAPVLLVPPADRIR
jgi:lysophospholipase L1-like esterase